MSHCLFDHLSVGKHGAATGLIQRQDSLLQPGPVPSTSLPTTSRRMQQCLAGPLADAKDARFQRLEMINRIWLQHLQQRVPHLVPWTISWVRLQTCCHRLTISWADDNSDATLFHQWLQQIGLQTMHSSLVAAGMAHDTGISHLQRYEMLLTTTLMLLPNLSTACLARAHCESFDIGQ